MRRYVLGMVGTVFFLLSSCMHSGIQSSKPEELVIFPAPPDTTRIQFLTYINTSRDVTGKQSGFRKFLFGEEHPMPIVRPYGVFAWRSRLYVCDTGLGGIEIMDFDKGVFELFKPGGKGMLRLPLNCCVDNAGNLFVADGNRRQIVLFDREGRYLDAFGEAGRFKPTDVAVLGDRIFVSDIAGQRICIYDTLTKNMVDSIVTDPEGKYTLYQPTNIALTAEKLYVSDFGDFTVKIFTAEGKYLTSVGGFGRSPGQFTRPKGLDTDEEGNLYVVDAAFENVQIFNPQNKLLMFFGGPGNMNLPAAISISKAQVKWFGKLVDESYEPLYIIFVSNQFGENKIGVYAFVRPRI